MSTSLVLILVKISGIAFSPHSSFMIFTVNPPPPYMVPLLVEIGCVYFFLYFMIVYLNETPSFLLSESGLISLDESLRQLSELRTQIARQYEEIGTDTKNVVQEILKLRQFVSQDRVYTTHVHSNFEALQMDAFNAISTAIRKIGMSGIQPRPSERVLEEKINWDELSREIVRRIQERSEAELFNEAVSHHMAKIQASNERTLGIEKITTELKSATDRFSEQYALVARRYRLLKILFGAWRTSLFIRLRVFDAALPVIVFAISQMFFAGLFDMLHLWAR